MSLILRPLNTSGFGAIVDVDLTSADAHLHTPGLLHALHQHRLLIFPSQHLNHADLLTAARCFGTVDTDVDHHYAVAGFPGLTTISNIVEDGTRIGIYDGDHEEEWHADNSFKPNMTTATLLYSVITPAQGGQTRFADATQAYADLPQRLKLQLEELRAIHSIQHLGALQSHVSGGQSSVAAGSLARDPEVEHPIVLTHPATGARSLLLGPMVIREIAGMAENDSNLLLADLLQRTTNDPYVYTHRWNQGDLVVWDNLAILHTASPCDSSRHHRLLYRTSVH